MSEKGLRIYQKNKIQIKNRYFAKKRSFRKNVHKIAGNMISKV